MLFSPSAQQALRALMYLAERHGSGPVPVRDVAAAQAIPRPYLAKILLRLRSAGILRSHKGPGGGYELARDAGAIRLGDIVGVFDEHPGLAQECVLGDGLCSDVGSCPLHERWRRLRNEFNASITSMSLADLSATVRGELAAPSAWRPWRGGSTKDVRRRAAGPRRVGGAS